MSCRECSQGLPGKARYKPAQGARITVAMLRTPARLFPALLGLLLVAVPIASLADSHSRQFVVSVRVLRQCRLDMTAVNSPRHALLGINCTRDTGYSVSLSRDVAAPGDAYDINGVGNGADETISLTVPAARWSQSQGAQTAPPLFLTIRY